MKYINKIFYPENNQRIIFLNPMATTIDYWINVLKIPEKWKQFELVFLNYPGYSNTPFCTIQSFEEMALEIKEDILQLEAKKTSLVGFSYGGNLAIHLISIIELQKLIIISSNPFIHPYERYLYEKLETNDLGIFTKRLIDFCYNKNEKKTNPFLHLTLYSSMKFNTSCVAIKQQIKHLKNNVFKKNLILKNLNPLIIIGKDDNTIFKDVESRYKKIFNDFSYLEIDKAGHFLLDTNPHILNDIENYITN